jgi:pimeloyl-ACP methyl ester carboxylesterase
MTRPMAGILPWVLVVAGLSPLGQQPASPTSPGSPGSPSDSGVRAGTATVDGVQLQYVISGAGDGDPVVLVHAGVFADWFKPLIEERALTERHRVISYHRVGYAGSTHVPGAVTLVQQAAHLRALLRHLGIARAHFVGHSSGANIAMQLALDAPEMVGTLALLEPAVMVPPTASTKTTTPDARAFVPVAIAQFRAGDKPGAIDRFMRGVSGADYRVALDARLPGAFAQAIADADTFFGQELPAVQQWQFTRIDAKRISQPVLAVTGEKSAAVSPVWPQRQALLLEWLPNVEGFVLPGATHLLHVENPRGMADRLVTFFAHHGLAKK